MERELGKEKAHEIVSDVANELSAEWITENIKDIEIKSRDYLGKAMAEAESCLHKSGILLILLRKKID